jgi:ankyrin repeat protein
MDNSQIPPFSSLLSSIYGTGTESTQFQPMTKDDIWNIVGSNVPIDAQFAAAFSLMVESGFDPLAIDPVKGTTLLSRTSEKGKTELVRLILTPPAEMSGFDQTAFRANVKEKIEIKTGPKHLHFNVASTSPHQTALHYACIRGHTEIVELLCEAGAWIFNPNCLGESPLHLAAYYRHKDIVEYLIKQPQVTHDFLDMQECESGGTPLHYASAVGDVEIVKLLCGAGASIQINTYNKETPLTAAVKNNHTDVAQFIIEHPQATPEFLNTKEEQPADGTVEIEGGNPLHYASWKGNLAIVEMLVAAGASIDISSDGGDTPIQLAASENYASIVEYLITQQSQRYTG